LLDQPTLLIYGTIYLKEEIAKVFQLAYKGNLSSNSDQKRGSQGEKIFIFLNFFYFLFFIFMEEKGMGSTI
jgi:hypothetical protein